MLKNFLLTIAAGLLILSCETNPTESLTESQPKSVGAFIMNEGGFGSENGSLSFYSFETHSVQNKIYKSINGSDLGDVVQSMLIVDTLGFIVVNNSNKIEVISTNSWDSTTTIDMPVGSSPRNIVYYNGRLYVTNLYTNTVSVLSVLDYSIETSILVGTNPEEIFITAGRAFVANSGFGSGNTVSVIDLETNQVIENIRVGDNPQAFIFDTEEQINLLCSGRYPAWGDSTDSGTNGGLYIIDPISMAVIDSLPIAGHPAFELAFDGSETGYFILDGNVQAYSTITHRMQSVDFLVGNYYSIEADPVSEQLFVTDAPDFTQDGRLYIFTLEGDLGETHTVGINPGAITFIYGRD